MNVAIIGSNEIGLATAILLAYMDHFVIIVDDNQERVDLLRKNAHFVEPHLNETINVVHSSLSFTTNLTDAIEASDIVYVASDLGYSKMEVCQIFAGCIKEKYRLLVNKTEDDLGATLMMENIISQKSMNFSIAYEVPFVNTGTLVTDAFYPAKMAIGTYDIRALKTLKTIYAPLTTQNIMLPAFIQRPNRIPTKIIWTDIASAELIWYGEKTFRTMKENFMAEMSVVAEKHGGKMDDVLYLVT